MSSEELLIFRIENELRSLKMKTKTLDEVSIRERLVRLNKTNPNSKFFILYVCYFVIPISSRTESLMSNSFSA